MAEKLWGHSPAGLFGSHLLGGYAGGEAEYLRVPFVIKGSCQKEKPHHTHGGIFPFDGAHPDNGSVGQSSLYVKR
jgi:hypothetical protein